MKSMNFKINRITICNFRCFDFVDTFLWDKTVIQGPNESGKSSLASAILWCLTGKDIEGNATFEIVPVGKYGQVSPCVELECEIDDRPATLKREYKAKFTRDKQFSDYAVTTYINGIETGVRKFQEWVSKNICDEKVFKILSNPKTFVEDCPKETKELMWQAQRRLLISIIGDQTNDLELVSGSDKFTALVEPLKRYDNASQYLAFLKKEFADKKKMLDSFEPRVQQQERNISKLENSDEEIEQLVKETKAKAAKLNAQNEEFKRNGNSEQVAEIKQKIASLEQEKSALQAKYNEDMKVLANTKAKYMAEADAYKQKCEEALRTIKKYTEALDKLRTTVVVEVCSTCGQKLRPVAIENSKRKLAERIKKGEQQTVEENRKAADYKAKYETTAAKASALMEPVFPSRIYEIQEEINRLLSEISSIPATGNMPGYEEKMKALEDQMDKLKEEFILSKKNKEVEEEIERIESEHKDNVSKMSKIQRALDLTTEFISFKCKSAEDAINALFDNVTFQLFEKNKSNDEIKETCILRYRGVKYEDLSYSTKVIASIEVVKAFQKVYNVTVPICLDNSESITGTVDTGAQTFFMRVKEELCPECNGESGRRNVDGTWTCKKCGHVWKKNLEIMEV